MKLLALGIDYVSLAMALFFNLRYNKKSKHLNLNSNSLYTTADPKPWWSDHILTGETSQGCPT